MEVVILHGKLQIELKLEKRIRIDNKMYYIVKQTGNNKFLIVHDPGEYEWTDRLSYNAQKIDSDDYNVYENSTVDNYLENT
mgnify:CR=1 FL=1